MARKRGIFFRPIFTFLNSPQHQARQQWGRWFSIVYRLPLIAYGLLAVLALIFTTVMPGFARVSLISVATVAQTNSQTGSQTITQSSPESASAQELEQRAKGYYDAGQFSDAVAAFDQAAILYRQSGNLEQAAANQINQARALQSLGLYNQAIVILQAVLQTPQQPTPLLQDFQVEIQCAEESDVLNPLRERLQKLPVSSINAATTVAALRSLGDALQVTGDLEQACTILHYSLELAETQPLTDALAPIYLSLGNLVRTQAIADLRLNHLTPEQAMAQLQKQLSPIRQELQRRQTEAAQRFMTQTGAALNYYQQATNGSGTSDRQGTNDATLLIQAQAQLNALSLRLDRQEWSEAAAFIPSLSPLLNNLPLSRSATEAHINLAQSLMRMSEQQPESASLSRSSDLMRQSAQLLATARQQAIDLGITQTESYALGSLGGLYERTQQWSEAKDLTQQALEKVNAVSVENLPHTVSDVDLAYRWYRQLGRILITQNEEDEQAAIESYEAAVSMLQKRLQLDIASSNLNYQLSFNQDAQEPVHRELMDLLLRSEEPSQENLWRVREVSTSLLEAELTSFLQEPCDIVTPEQIDRFVQQRAQRVAIFYPIILPDRLEVIVKLPDNQNLLHYRHLIPQEQLLEKLDSLQLALEEDYTFNAVETLSQQFYEWIVQPAEEQLEANQVDTLVFTLDRQLQTIPMAALYDGETYLIDKYAISEFLGLRVGGSVEPLQQQELKIMAAGLSFIPPLLPENIRDNFLPLNHVNQELDEIDALQDDGIRVITLRDDNFTLPGFNTRLNEDQFPVIHLATHGQFSVDPQRTFLLTSGELTNGLIEVNELAALFRTRGQIRLDSIELLVLNACETAAGDNLATLGLAGTAVRAGARSAIASLWTLDDAPSVDFTRVLYEHLRQPNVTKAEALRQAQLELMHNPQYRHPRYWSPYILAGNWLPLTTSSSSGLTGSNPSN